MKMYKELKERRNEILKKGEETRNELYKLRDIMEELKAPRDAFRIKVDTCGYTIRDIEKLESRMAELESSMAVLEKEYDAVQAEINEIVQKYI